MAAADSKLRNLEDKDEWIFHSMNRYTHLYMFDLEFPVDAFEVINDSSLCLAGLQTYSKNCELVQLSIPPKLLPANMEDGLCKDRDFNIISGGYSSHRITQIKAVHSNPKLLTTVQAGKAGVALFELGDENHAVIIPKGNLSLARLASSSLVQVTATQGNQIVLGNNFGKLIHEWTLDSQISSSTCIHHTIPEDLGGITKLKFWDENSVIFSTSKGGVAIYDLRASQIGVQIQSSKSAVDIPLPSVVETIPIPMPQEISIPEGKKVLKVQAVTTSSSLGSKIETSIPEVKKIVITESTEKSPEEKDVEVKTTPPILWSFDTVTPLNKIGIVDSCGGYETFDIRKLDPTVSNRVILPGCVAKELLGQKFNIEYEPYRGFGSEIKFIVTGMKDENVLVYSDRVTGRVMEVSPVFSHDGHSSTVTHATWHPLTKNLLFSTSANSTLHAWQYIH